MGFPNVDYKAVMDQDYYLGKSGFVVEMIGTAFWFFLAGTLDNNMFGLGRGGALALSFLIVKSCFNGDFNAMTTLRKMTEMSDCNIVQGFTNLIAQALGGLVGFWFFKTGLGLEFMVARDTTSFMTIAEEGQWQSHLLLLLALVVYFKFRDANKSMPAWFFDIVMLSMVFFLGGQKFLFAPNMVFNVACKDAVAALTNFWDPYLQYAIYAWIARALCNLWNCEGDFGKVLPRWE